MTPTTFSLLSDALSFQRKMRRAGYSTKRVTRAGVAFPSSTILCKKKP